MTGDPFYRETDSYRIAVDTAGVGSIRILRRVNFRTFILLLREVYVEIQKKGPSEVSIVFFVSRSLYDEMSGNVREFLDFCAVCMDTRFELIILE
jgi:hypothetical protein